MPFVGDTNAIESGADPPNEAWGELKPGQVLVEGWLNASQRPVLFSTACLGVVYGAGASFYLIGAGAKASTGEATPWPDKNAQRCVRAR